MIPDGMNYSRGVDVNSKNEIFVSYLNQQKLFVFDEKGTFLREFGGHPELKTRDLLIDGDDNVFVCGERKIIFVFDKKGNLIRKIGEPQIKDHKSIAIGHFEQPMGMDIDEMNRVYIVDWSKNIVQVFG